jgi:hypothetical protein
MLTTAIRGTGMVQELPGIDLAHDGELQQVRRLAVDVRPGVDENDRPVGRGDGGRDRRPVDARHFFKDEQASHHHRP